MIDKDKPLTLFVCPSNCEHVMDKEVSIITDSSTIYTLACSKCGATAFDLALMRDQ